MSTTYKNSFHVTGSKDTHEWLSTNAKPTKYKGWLIYERVKGSVWDVVKDGVCEGMYAGLNGAKRSIDTRLNIKEAVDKINSLI